MQNTTEIQPFTVFLSTPRLVKHYWKNSQLAQFSRSGAHPLRAEVVAECRPEGIYLVVKCDYWEVREKSSLVELADPDRERYASAFRQAVLEYREQNFPTYQEWLACQELVSSDQ